MIHRLVHVILMRDLEGGLCDPESGLCDHMNV